MSLQQRPGPGSCRRLFWVAQCLLNNRIPQALLDHESGVPRLSRGSMHLRTRQQGIVPKVGPNAKAEVTSQGASSFSDLRRSVKRNGLPHRVDSRSVPSLGAEERRSRVRALDFKPLRAVILVRGARVVE